MVNIFWQFHFFKDIKNQTEYVFSEEDAGVNFNMLQP